MPSLKRKREVPTAQEKPVKESDAGNDTQEIFRRHFEARFGPVKGLAKAKTIIDQKLKAAKKKGSAKEAAGTTDDDGWGGFSDDERDWVSGSEDDEKHERDKLDFSKDEDIRVPSPDVIVYDFSKRSSAPVERPTKSASRKFMSSKPPQLSSSAIPSANPKTKGTDDGEDEQANIKNDLSLQRLLAESHLLDQSTLSHASGRNRHLATESRIKSLGGKAISTQKNAPMNIRKGIATKKDERETKRRKDAKEAGIVLERPVKKARKEDWTKRDQGVGGPSIGKFKRGALVLSKEDVKTMTSERGKSSRGREKKRR